MKVTFGTIIVLLSILLGSCTSNRQQYVRESKKNEFDKRLIYVIDGKQSSKAEAIRQYDACIANVIEAAPESRSAILQYGEKYRYGIFILVTNDKEKK